MSSPTKSLQGSSAHSASLFGTTTSVAPAEERGGMTPSGGSSLTWSGSSPVAGTAHLKGAGMSESLRSTSARRSDGVLR